MAVVTFDPVAFAAAYPEFAAVSQARTTAMFTLASQTLLDNTDNSPVMDINYRTQLFSLLVAHLLTILGGAPTTPTNTPPGRISTATEGTVTANFEYILPAGSAMAPWFIQTKYGAMYWTAVAPFRSAIYIQNGASGIGEAVAYGAPPLLTPAGFLP